MSPMERMWEFQRQAVRLAVELGLTEYCSAGTKLRVADGTADIEEILADEELERICLADFDRLANVEINTEPGPNADRFA